MSHPFADLVGLTIEDNEAGASTASVTIDPARHHNPHGVVHGALYFALADTGMGAALYPTLNEGEICATIDVKINFFRPAVEGTLICKTQLINKGRTTANLDSSIYLGDKLVARANGDYAIIAPKPS
jgi:acyl-CoA thioesterase